MLSLAGLNYLELCQLFFSSKRQRWGNVWKWGLVHRDFPKQEDVVLNAMATSLMYLPQNAIFTPLPTFQKKKKRSKKILYFIKCLNIFREVHFEGGGERRSALGVSRNKTYTRTNFVQGMLHRSCLKARLQKWERSSHCSSVQSALQG